VATGKDAAWMVICQAWDDTNGDGSRQFTVGMLDSFLGDAVTPHLAIGGGEGAPIDTFESSSPAGRYVAVTRGESLIVIDTHRETAAIVDRRVPSTGAQPLARVSDSGQVVYLEADILVVYDLASGTRREHRLDGTATGLGYLDDARGHVAVGIAPWSHATVAVESRGHRCRDTPYRTEAADPVMKLFDLERGAFVATGGAPRSEPPRREWPQDARHRRIVARRSSRLLVDSGRELEPLLQGPLVWTTP